MAMSESKALRTWARAQGFAVGERGVLPESLRDQWIAAGAPWPEGESRPAIWTPEARKRNNPRSNGHVRRTSATAIHAEAAGAPAAGAAGFEKPSPPTREELGLDPLVVELVAGGRVEVMTQAEADWLIEAQRRYLEENHFEAIADRLDLDRLLAMELQAYRLNHWLSGGKDYLGNRIDVVEVGKGLKDRNASIQQLKDAMGLSKKARDAAAVGVDERWKDLLKRARKWNYHRVEQVRTALLLANQLKAIVGTFDRSDEEERRRTGFRDEAEIVAWVRETFIPQFTAVDEHFRENEQSTWKRG